MLANPSGQQFSFQQSDMSSAIKTPRSEEPPTPRKSVTSSPIKKVNGSSRSRGSVSDVALPDITNARDCSMDYLAELIKEKKQMDIFPSMFQQSERLLEDEINRVRGGIFQTEFVFLDPTTLPEPFGEVNTYSDKLYVPKKEFPEYNFVGRILGPRGLTAKQLEQETGCKIMVRGRGSMRDVRKEEQNRGKPSWEHLDDDLHVLIQCEDTWNRAKIRIDAALKNVKKLLTPSPEGTDELKRKQLTELAIINGTFKAHKSHSTIPRLMAPMYPCSPMRQVLYSPQPQSSPSPLNLPLLQSQSPVFTTNNEHGLYDMFSLPAGIELHQQNQGQTVLPPLTPLSGFPGSFYNTSSLHSGHFFHDSHFANQANITPASRQS